MQVEKPETFGGTKNLSQAAKECFIGWEVQKPEHRKDVRAKVWSPGYLARHDPEEFQRQQDLHFGISA
jgi:hypothetical protein